MSKSTEEPEPAPTEPFSFHGGAIRLSLDLKVYRLSAIQKTGYRFAARCTAILGESEGHRLPVTLVFRPETTEADALEIGRLFFQEMLDQELREQVGDETRALRNLIIAQAFSKTDLIRRE
jgi:His-Xaa-Ser system protein HxsD